MNGPSWYIRGGRVVDPATNRDEIADLYIRDGCLAPLPPTREHGTRDHVDSPIRCVQTLPSWLTPTGEPVCASNRVAAGTPFRPCSSPPRSCYRCARRQKFPSPRLARLG